jgi:hypothetical protein
LEGRKRRGLLERLVAEEPRDVCIRGPSEWRGFGRVEVFWKRFWGV